MILQPRGHVGKYVWHRRASWRLPAVLSLRCRRRSCRNTTPCKHIFICLNLWIASDHTYIFSDSGYTHQPDIVFLGNARIRNIFVWIRILFGLRTVKFQSSRNYKDRWSWLMFFGSSCITETSVSDLDRIRIQLGQWIRIRIQTRIQEGKNDPQN